MTDFSIELASERIYDPQTKEYFREVLSSYINGNHRSAVVMLWTVVICDFVYKLRQMRDVYGDETARKILEEIEKNQQSKPKSPDWEEKLLGLINDRTALLEQAEYVQLQHLQEQRHLSAHPILDQALTLHSPNRETTRSLIRNALEAVLMKPPLLTKKIIETFVEDIAEKQDMLPDMSSLSRYISATYLNNLTPAVENDLFRALWKFAFQLSNPDTDKNRAINIRVLDILYHRRSGDLNKHILDQADAFSRVEPALMKELIAFLSDHPSIFKHLNDTARTLVENALENDINLFVEAVFISESVEEHLQRIVGKIKNTIDSGWNDIAIFLKSWERIIEFFEIADTITQMQVLDAIVDAYSSSRSYNAADILFEGAVHPLLDMFTPDHLQGLLDGIEGNRQTYDRRRAKEDHNMIKSRCDAMFEPNFDYLPYPNFLDSIN